MSRSARTAGAAAVVATLLTTGVAATPAHAEDPAKALRLGAKEKLIPRGTVTDADGTVHTRYARTYEGLPVLGGDLVVHASGNGRVEDVTKATEETIKVPTTTAKVPAPAARRSAAATAPGSSAVGQEPRKVIWAGRGKPVLAYETVVTGRQKDGTPSRLHVITDATSGKRLFAYEAVHSGTGTSQWSGKVKVGSVKSGKNYVMKDTARGGSQVFNARHKKIDEAKFPAFGNPTDTWGNGKASMPQTAAVDAQYGAAATWDYFKAVHGRKGIRNDGKGAPSYVHYDDGMDNAFWDNDRFFMAYGDGPGNKRPFTSLDVAAHEMSHGVTGATAGLYYFGESGGLDEATSDIFAAMVEFHTKNAKDPADYLFMEKLEKKPERYMDRPSKDGHSADYWFKGVDALDPHLSSGIGNHFYFLLAEGSGAKTINGVRYDSPTKDGKKVTGIGRDAAEKIWYKAVTAYMTSTTDYKGARAATLKAARDMYGTKSKQYKTVQAAWDGVNVK
ncbi:M4 family metallopeptidase [Streptomyces sp. NPDC021100]|uniref:M4 family metallopeptidase n=1 Tax=Streptomyces sp. NPDC021100 TaxID=3365114 RepID=UPI0037AF9232